MKTAVCVPAAQDAPASRPVPATDGVAGSILPTDQPLQVLIREWVAMLSRTKKAPSTVERWGSMLPAHARAAGWTHPEHIAGAAIEDYLTARAVAEKWSGATLRAYAAAWRSFTRWAARRSYIDADPMLAMDTVPIEEHGAGARAATTEEARALLASTAVLERMDKRACPRLAYFAMLFLAGCRAGEPCRLRWSDLRLEDPTPNIIWRAETQKNRRRAVLSLAPELVHVLRRHLLSARRGAGFSEDAAVFPARPNPRTFTTDAERAGLTLKDRDGASLSFHSARKWFATTLTNAGVHQRMVDHLMRHTGSVESRYFRPTLEEQADALRFLPPLGLVIQGVTARAPKIEHAHCRQSPTGADTQGANSEPLPVHLTREISTPHFSAAGRPNSQLDNQSKSAGSSFHAEQVSPLASNPGSAGPSTGRNRGNAVGSRDQTVRSLVAMNRAALDAIEALLLREESGDVSDRSPAVPAVQHPHPHPHTDRAAAG